jgi:hypothetical protein
VRTEAQFPAVDERAGHYESFYLKAAAPGGGRALWIRHTVHKRPGSEPTCSIWFTDFGGASRPPRATKATFGADRLEVPEGGYLRVADAEIGPGRAVGRIETGELRAEWDLRFDDRHESFRHLPSERMYRASLPRTKLLSPHPGALFTGTLEIDGESRNLEAWPGMVGHNWGAEHAERWIWIHGADFDGGPSGDYLDLAAGRVRVGPLQTPWIANGSLVIGGEAYRLGGIGRVYGTDIEAEPTSCSFVVPGKGITVRGTVSAPPERFVGWIYADPDGGEHNTVNSSIADLEVRVERPSQKHVHLRLPGAATYELGMRETDHGIAIRTDQDG